MYDPSKTVDLALLNKSELKVECSMEGILAFMVAISDLFEVDNQVQAISVSIIPAEYLDLTKVFSEDAANTLPDYGPQDLSLKTTEGLSLGSLYNFSQVELEVLKGYISDNLAKSFIQPSTLSVDTAVLFAQRGDGSLGLHVDHWGLNLITQKNRYLLPPISKSLDRVVGANIYTKLDIRADYNRVGVKAGDERKTAFCSRYAHYEYRFMSLRAVNGPAIFQNYIKSILRKYLDILCISYLDDILIYSLDPFKDTETLCQVPKRLPKHGFFVKL